MSKRIDLTGRKFGRLTVLGYAFSSKSGIAKWDCICDCGEKSIVEGGKLKNGHTKSCGCLKIELTRKRTHKHGMTDTPEFRIWLGIIKRCTNEKYKDFAHYGGRGIKISQDWRNDFLKFYSDMGPRPTAKLSIERKDVNGDYCKDNCVWATQTTQTRNQRVRKDNESGVKGITRDKRYNKWVARIRVNNKLIHIGRYNELEEAKEARRKAELKYWSS